MDGVNTVTHLRLDIADNDRALKRHKDGISLSVSVHQWTGYRHTWVCIMTGLWKAHQRDMTSRRIIQCFRSLRGLVDPHT